MSNEQRVERRRQVLAEYRASGMTQKAFCREHDIALSTLRFWLKRDRDSNKAHSEFVQIGSAPKEIEKRRQGTVRIRAGAQLELEVDLPVGREQLVEILQAAASL